MQNGNKKLSREEVLYRGLTEFLALNKCSPFESVSLLLMALGSQLGENYSREDTNQSIQFLKKRAEETRKLKGKK